MDIYRRNRLSYNLHNLIKGIFDFSAYLFGNLYVYQKFGFWGMVQFAIALTACMSFGSFLSDDLIRRFQPKRALLLGLLFDISAFTIFGFYFKDFLLVPLGMITGIGASITSTTSSMMVSQNLDDSKTGKQQAWWENISSIVFMSAPLFSTYIVGSSSFANLFQIILAGHLLSLLPLAFYNDMVHVDGISKHSGLWMDFRELSKSYNFRSDSWRMFLSCFGNESYLSVTLLILYLLFRNNFTTVGWLLTGSSVISLLLRWLAGRRFDRGEINIPRWPSILNSVTWWGFIATLSHPFWSGVFKGLNNSFTTISNFPANTSFYRNVKQNCNRQYSAAVFLVGFAGSLFLYLPLISLYLATNNLLLTLFILNVSLGILPLLRYYIYNRQK